ncbi:MAG: MMPL family transporter, partial [Gammaproteobacteria bacterium]
ERGTPLSFGIEVTEEFGLVSPEMLRRVDEFSAWLREQEGVQGVASLVEVVKTVHQIMRDDVPEAYIIPDSEAEIEDALFNYTVAQVRDFSIDTLANEDFTLMRLFVAVDIDSNQALLALSERIDTQFAQRFPDARLLHGSATLLFARMDHAVTVELLQGYGLSLALITLTLVLGMGSLYYGVLSMVPNLLPAVLVFGAWGLFVGRLDPFVMMLFSISIGLVVDDTVHMLSTYHSARREGLEPEAAISRALHRAGPALIITTAVLALGTCVLIAASTLYFQQAATLLVPIVVVALLLDISFFPALLLRVDRRQERVRSG